MGRVTNFFNCNILRDGRIMHEDLWVRGGKIVNPVDVQYTADLSIDCDGAVISPGFIDIKLNGALGVHFTNPSHLIPDKLAKVRAFLPYTGVTLFCPTIESAAPETYREVLSKLKCTRAGPESGAGIVGVHLDGPFISVTGAHNAQLQQKFADNPGGRIKEVYGDNIEDVAVVTLAPDLEQSAVAIKHLTRLGIRVAIGHTRVKTDVAEAAVKNGATLISHLFNAMPDFHHRDPGVVGLITSPKVQSLVRFTIIADRFHVHPATLRMAYRINPDALMLCTDGQAPLGLGPGEYDFDGQQIQVEETDGLSVCYRLPKRTLYGSVCPFHRAVRNFRDITECDLAYALEAGSKKPAQVLGIWPQKGSLEFGADADFVLLRPDTLDLVATFIEGCKVADNGQCTDMKQVHLACTAPDYYSPSQKLTSPPEAPERVSAKRRKSMDS